MVLTTRSGSNKIKDSTRIKKTWWNHVLAKTLSTESARSRLTVCQENVRKRASHVRLVRQVCISSFQ